MTTSPPLSPTPASPTIVSSLPHQHHPRPPLEEGPRRSYRLETTEALEGGKIVRLLDEKGRAVWEKTRDLTDEEIVDTIFDGTRHPRWTIHRPIRGWYLVLRSPSLPPGSYISFKPNPSSAEGSGFTFALRSVLEYPVTSPLSEKGDDLDAVRLTFSAGDNTPTPTSAPTFSEAQDHPPAPAGEKSEKPIAPSPTTSHFKLQHGLPAHTHRASSRPFSLSSFTHLFAGRGKTFSCVWEDEQGAEVLRFEEDVSLLSTTTRGHLLLHEHLVGIIGMEPSFWIAVALAYLEFLEDREAYGAAKGGD
ncbi:hypothetical protein BCR35DRAFT_305726 [Leucosporidium creatinivorum]|uniref:Tubby C-terminal-like domain-containing protein n=1 Tax=Leucosporidium creatinivorum TaxID=106004 RepID=A0A1Y2EY01_9BASI|nr:hypothetical protein BCR35DRAFT_305726 [Leucosporidium creatinivorum]